MFDAAHEKTVRSKRHIDGDETATYFEGTTTVRGLNRKNDGLHVSRMLDTPMPQKICQVALPSLYLGRFSNHNIWPHASNANTTGKRNPREQLACSLVVCRQTSGRGSSMYRIDGVPPMVLRIDTNIAVWKRAVSSKADM